MFVYVVATIIYNSKKFCLYACCWQNLGGWRSLGPALLPVVLRIWLAIWYANGYGESYSSLQSPRQLLNNSIAYTPVSHRNLTGMRRVKDDESPDSASTPKEQNDRYTQTPRQLLEALLQGKHVLKINLRRLILGVQRRVKFANGRVESLGRGGKVHSQSQTLGIGDILPGREGMHLVGEDVDRCIDVGQVGGAFGGDRETPAPGSIVLALTVLALALRCVKLGQGLVDMAHGKLIEDLFWSSSAANQYANRPANDTRLPHAICIRLTQSLEALISVNNFIAYRNS